MSNTDERLKKSADIRAPREQAERSATENREVMEDERVEMFRQQMFQSALPELPKIPGWHTCWLTTSNPRDSIQARMRLGYEPIKAGDIPGWEYNAMKTGEYQGFIGVNEMLAFKLPMSLYEKFMKEVHHDAPLREEGKLTEMTALLSEQAERSKSRVDMGDGIKEMGQSRKAQFELT